MTAAVPDCGAAFGDAALAVASGTSGVAAPEVPGGGLFGAVPGLPGVALGAVDVLGGALFDGAGPGGALPDGFAEVAPPDDEALPPDCVAPPKPVGSVLRMIGRPSLPEPITTTLALGDCASKSVASMPRQRK